MPEYLYRSKDGDEITVFAPIRECPPEGARIRRCGKTFRRVFCAPRDTFASADLSHVSSLPPGTPGARSYTQGKRGERGRPIVMNKHDIKEIEKATDGHYVYGAYGDPTKPGFILPPSEAGQPGIPWEPGKFRS